jgi:hypothetical protein
MPQDQSVCCRAWSNSSEFSLIHLVTRVLSSDEVMKAVAEGLTDLGFAFSPSPTERVTTHLHRRFRIAPLSPPIAQIGIATRLQSGSFVFVARAESEPATEEFAAITDVRTVPKLAPATFLDHVLNWPTPLFRT